MSPSVLGHPIAVTELEDGLGARTGYDYVRIGPSANTLTYPESPFGALAPVPDAAPADLAAVGEFRTSDGLSEAGVRRWTYRYRGVPQLSSRSRGYLGMPEVRITDGQAGRSRRLQAERAGATGGHQEIRAGRRDREPKGGKPRVGQSIDRHDHQRFATACHDHRATAAKLGQSALCCDVLGCSEQAGTATDDHITTQTFLSRGNS